MPQESLPQACGSVASSWLSNVGHLTSDRWFGLIIGISYSSEIEPLEPLLCCLQWSILMIQRQKTTHRQGSFPWRIQTPLKPLAPHSDVLVTPPLSPSKAEAVCACVCVPFPGHPLPQSIYSMSCTNAPKTPVTGTVSSRVVQVPKLGSPGAEYSTDIQIKVLQISLRLSSLACQSHSHASPMIPLLPSTTESGKPGTMFPSFSGS